MSAQNKSGKKIGDMGPPMVTQPMQRRANERRRKAFKMQKHHRMLAVARARANDSAFEKVAREGALDDMLERASDARVVAMTRLVKDTMDENLALLCQIDLLKLEVASLQRDTVL